MTSPCRKALYTQGRPIPALDLLSSPYTFFLESAKVGLNDGAMFGKAGKTCVRLNFATSETIVREVLACMASAVQRVHAGKA